MGLRVGIDLVAVADIEASLRAHGERYLRRVFTSREVEDSRTGEQISAERLAARFAAKEAAMKTLRIGDDALSWHDIEVRREEGGWVELALHGRAAELAAAAGVIELAVSLTHEGGYASAVVVAEIRSPSRYSPHER
jgi:holo-[acyl-carrier protein] synthase